MNNQYIKDLVEGFNESYRYRGVLNLMELNEILNWMDEEFQHLMYNASYVVKEAERCGEIDTAKEFKEIRKMLSEQYEKLPHCDIELATTVPVEVRRHLYELTKERHQYGVAGYLNPERAREIQNEIQTILSQYDR